MSNPAETIRSSASSTILATLEQRLSAAEAGLAEAAAGLAAERASGARTRRQMRVTWAVSSLACLLTFTFGFSPQSRAQFGVTLTSLNTAVLALQAKTASMSVLTDPNTNEPTVRFSGVNVQVVSGSGSTGGTLNGTGNLIVGYNELRGNNTDIRTGSHNFIVGTENSYSSYGGTDIGGYNTASSQYASVSGGYNNTASGQYASVSGGSGNIASGSDASVSGGDNNTASYFCGSVSGGTDNTASFFYASVSGGMNNTASFTAASVSGGSGNMASGYYASVSGGQNNAASGDYASVSGGHQLTNNTSLGCSAGSLASGGVTSGNFSSP